VLVVNFPAAAFETNCYVVATKPGEQCVVIDPGVDVVDTLDEVFREQRLQPVAVLLTHGHLDHTFSVAPVCGARGIPAWIHPGDRKLLEDPMLGVSEQSRNAFGGRLEWTEPDDVRPLADGTVVELAGLSFSVDHAPGHTQGSVMFRLPPDEDVNAQLLFSGDVLFQGSIGRTDLPGGDYQQMLHSLANKVLPLPNRTLVLPGHGNPTTIRDERRSNPYLAEAKPLAAPRRGL
jgi:glyoxylase-like metal-dependent hydrolase (beta-lactamase superfamily II)